MKDIADIRQDYQKAELDETATGDNPIFFFAQWFSEAQNAKVTEVNAMTLATVDEHNHPDARIVLLKGVEKEQFIFYTNYNSSKGRDINHNPNVCLVFFWKELERQVRIRGTISKVAAEVSDAYFQSRPQGSRLGAWASPQSHPIKSRDILVENYKLYEQAYLDKEIPRPSHWGGYAVEPKSIEFWQGRSNRMHDRLLFELDNNNTWQKSRLAP